MSHEQTISFNEKISQTQTLTMREKIKFLIDFEAPTSIVITPLLSHVTGHHLISKILLLY